MKTIKKIQLLAARFDDAKLGDMPGSEGAANDQTASTDRRDDSRTRIRAAPSWEQGSRFPSFDSVCHGARQRTPFVREMI